MDIKLISPAVSIIVEKDPFKKIEVCGRNCYKSQSPITDSTARDFYQRRLKEGHYTMLEHATFVFELTGPLSDTDEIKLTVLDCGCGYLNYTRTQIKFGEKSRVLVSGNLRAIIDSGIKFLYDALLRVYPNILEGTTSRYTSKYESVHVNSGVKAEIVDLSLYSSLSEEEVLEHNYTTFFITTDREVTHEIVRHRPASYAQESTRYCNYTKPYRVNGVTLVNNNPNSTVMQFIKPADFDVWTLQAQDTFKETLKYCADKYEALVTTEKCTPQQARGVLPNALKADIIMTTNDREWTHFFNLRYFGTTGKPHPNMQEVAALIFNIWKNDPNFKRTLTNK